MKSFLFCSILALKFVFSSSDCFKELIDQFKEFLQDNYPQDREFESICNKFAERFRFLSEKVLTLTPSSTLITRVTELCEENLESGLFFWANYLTISKGNLIYSNFIVKNEDIWLKALISLVSYTQESLFVLKSFSQKSKFIELVLALYRKKLRSKFKALQKNRDLFNKIDQKFRRLEFNLACEMYEYETPTDIRFELYQIYRTILTQPNDFR
jgi:hypothetical protein